MKVVTLKNRFFNVDRIALPWEKMSPRTYIDREKAMPGLQSFEAQADCFVRG